jgi:hypothetical protein
MNIRDVKKRLQSQEQRSGLERFAIFVFPFIIFINLNPRLAS